MLKIVESTLLCPRSGTPPTLRLRTTTPRRISRRPPDRFPLHQPARLQARFRPDEEGREVDQDHARSRMSAIPVSRKAAVAAAAGVALVVAMALDTTVVPIGSKLDQKPGAFSPLAYGRSEFPAVQSGGSLTLAWQVRNKKVLVVGGGEVCQHTRPCVQTMLLTLTRASGCSWTDFKPLERRCKGHGDQPSRWPQCRSGISRAT